jgi:hypothetical protein
MCYITKDYFTHKNTSFYQDGEANRQDEEDFRFFS